MTPTESYQVLVSDVNRAFVKQWISGYSKNRQQKCLLLLGPSGVGKSTLAQLCLKESSYTVITVAADTYRNKKILERDLKDAIRLPLKQSILIEDPQVMVSDGGLHVIANFCKQGGRIPTIVVCAQSKKSKIQQLLSCSEQVVFKPLPANVIADRLDCDVNCCRGGDLRQICGRIASGYQSSKCDENFDIQEAGFSLLQGQPVNDGLRMYRLDCQALGNIVHANYIDLVDNITIAADVADDLSTADIMFHGDLAEDLAGIVGTVTAGNRIHKAPKKPRPDLLWTKTALRQTRVRGLSSSGSAFLRSGTTLDIWSLPLVREAMMQAARQGKFTDVVAWAPDASLQQITNVLRISYIKCDAAINKFRRSIKRVMST